MFECEQCTNSFFKCSHVVWTWLLPLAKHWSPFINACWHFVCVDQCVWTTCLCASVHTLRSCVFSPVCAAMFVSCLFGNHSFQMTKETRSWVGFVKDKQQPRVTTIILSCTNSTSVLSWRITLHNGQASYEQLIKSEQWQRGSHEKSVCVKSNLFCMPLTLMCAWLLKYLLPCSLAESGGHQLNKNLTNLLNLLSLFLTFLKLSSPLFCLWITGWKS